MSQPDSEIFDKLILSEILLSQLYAVLANIFPEDTELWTRLVQEEKGHAAILSSGKEILHQEELFPPELLEVSWSDLDSSINRKQNLITTLKAGTKYLTRDNAMTLAIEFEEADPVEKLFQALMEKDTEREDLIIFQQLNSVSSDHATRIRKYRQENQEK